MAAAARMRMGRWRSLAAEGRCAVGLAAGDVLQHRQGVTRNSIDREHGVGLTLSAASERCTHV